MNTIFKKFATGTAAFALMTTVFATGVMAEGTNKSKPVEANIQGGIFAISEVNADNFGTVTLEGKKQKAEGASIEFIVTDATGLGNGWSISAHADPFTNGEKELEEGFLTIGTPVVKIEGEGSSDSESITTNGGRINAESPLKILNARTDGGMGSYKVTLPSMELDLMPKEVYAGKYSSMVKLTLTTEITE